MPERTDVVKEAICDTMEVHSLVHGGESLEIRTL